MDEKLKIKLSIADRVYPLTIDPRQEEGLRKAAKNIEIWQKSLSKTMPFGTSKMCWPCVPYNLLQKLSKVE